MRGRLFFLPLLLLATLATACSASRSEDDAASSDSASTADSRTAFSALSDALVAFAAPFGARDGTTLVIEIDDAVTSFRAKTDLVKPTAEEKARGIRARRRITIGAGVLEDPLVTPPALALVLCHELGHHYGGYPFQKADHITASEGSADYFATRVCGPALLGKLEPAALPESERAAARERCRAAGHDGAACVDLLAASLSMITVVHARSADQPALVPPYETHARGGGKPSLATTDTFAVARTVGGRYPSAQCRLDTLVRGAMCGLAKPTLARSDADAPQTEREALDGSCSVDSFEPGARPPCWFHEGSAATTISDALDVVWTPR